MLSAGETVQWNSPVTMQSLSIPSGSSMSIGSTVTLSGPISLAPNSTLTLSLGSSTTVQSIQASSGGTVNVGDSAALLVSGPVQGANGQFIRSVFFFSFLFYLKFVLFPPFLQPLLSLDLDP